MPKEKKRPSKKAKAAMRAVKDSKLLAVTKAAHEASSDEDLRSHVVTPRTLGANKLRPEKKINPFPFQAFYDLFSLLLRS